MSFKGEKRFKCDWNGCDKDFTALESLHAHRRSHTGERPFKCAFNGCNRAFSCSSYLRRHTRVHKAEKHFKCQLKDCNSSFRSGDSLRRHTLKHKGETFIYKCEFPDCNRVFNWKKSINRHMRMHNEGKKYRCDFDGCKISYSNRRRLARHKLTHRLLPKFCNFFGCSLSFKSSDELTNHKLSHAGETPYKCDWIDCNLSFKHKFSLTYHRRYHTGDTIKCKFKDCNFVAPIAGVLNRHYKRTHINQKRRRITYSQILYMKSQLTKNPTISDSKVNLTSKVVDDPIDSGYDVNLIKEEVTTCNSEVSSIIASSITSKEEEEDASITEFKVDVNDDNLRTLNVDTSAIIESSMTFKEVRNDAIISGCDVNLLKEEVTTYNSEVNSIFESFIPLKTNANSIDESPINSSRSQDLIVKNSITCNSDRPLKVTKSIISKGKTHLMGNNSKNHNSKGFYFIRKPVVSNPNLNGVNLTDDSRKTLNVEASSIIESSMTSKEVKNDAIVSGCNVNLINEEDIIFNNEVSSTFESSITNASEVNEIDRNNFNIEASSIIESFMTSEEVKNDAIVSGCNVNLINEENTIFNSEVNSTFESSIPLKTNANSIIESPINYFGSQDSLIINSKTCNPALTLKVTNSIISKSGSNSVSNNTKNLNSKGFYFIRKPVVSNPKANEVLKNPYSSSGRVVVRFKNPTDPNMGCKLFVKNCNGASNVIVKNVHNSNRFNFINNPNATDNNLLGKNHTTSNIGDNFMMKKTMPFKNTSNLEINKILNSVDHHTMVENLNIGDNEDILMDQNFQTRKNEINLVNPITSDIESTDQIIVSSSSRGNLRGDTSFGKHPITSKDKNNLLEKKSIHANSEDVTIICDDNINSMGENTIPFNNGSNILVKNPTVSDGNLIDPTYSNSLDNLLGKIPAIADGKLINQNPTYSNSLDNLLGETIKIGGCISLKSKDSLIVENKITLNSMDDSTVKNSNMCENEEILIDQNCKTSKDELNFISPISRINDQRSISSSSTDNSFSKNPSDDKNNSISSNNGVNILVKTPSEGKIDLIDRNSRSPRVLVNNPLTEVNENLKTSDKSKVILLDRTPANEVMLKNTIGLTDQVNLINENPISSLAKNSKHTVILVSKNRLNSNSGFSFKNPIISNIKGNVNSSIQKPVYRVKAPNLLVNNNIASKSAGNKIIKMSTIANSGNNLRNSNNFKGKVVLLNENSKTNKSRGNLLVKSNVIVPKTSTSGSDLKNSNTFRGEAVVTDANSKINKSSGNVIVKMPTAANSKNNLINSNNCKTAFGLIGENSKINKSEGNLLVKNCMTNSKDNSLALNPINSKVNLPNESARNYNSDGKLVIKRSIYFKGVKLMAHYPKHSNRDDNSINSEDKIDSSSNGNLFVKNPITSNSKGNSIVKTSKMTKGKVNLTNKNSKTKVKRRKKDEKFITSYNEGDFLGRDPVTSNNGGNLLIEDPITSVTEDNLFDEDSITSATKGNSFVEDPQIPNNRGLVDKDVLMPLNKNNLMACQCKDAKNSVRMNNLDKRIQEFTLKCGETDCNTILTSLDEVEEHLKTHAKIKYKFNCDFIGCNLFFKTKDEFKKHRREHYGMKQYKCTFDSCDATFRYLHGFRKHMLRHEQPLTTYRCAWSGCGKSFTSRVSHEYHMSDHTGEKPFKCDFEGCKMSFNIRKRLASHIKIHRIYKNPFKCIMDGCESRFATLELVKAHMSEIHAGDEEAPSWISCDKSVESSENVR